MMSAGPKDKTIIWLMLVICSATLLSFAIVHFHIRNMSLSGGNWDEGNLWILFAKSSAGLRPNVDFVSGYPGGFEALIFLLGRLFEFNFFSVQIVQWVVLALYFASAYWVLSRFLSRTSSAGAAGLVAYAGYGAWVSLSPGSLVQLISILLLGLIVPKKRRTRGQLFIIGALAALCLLLKQSGIFIIVAATGLLCLRSLRLASRFGSSGRFLALLPFNLPFIGYLLLRFDETSAPFINHVVLLPWIVMMIFLNTQILTQPMAHSTLQISFVFKAMLVRLSPFLFGLVAVLAFFPYYYGSELGAVFYEIFFRMPGLIDRDANSLGMFMAGPKFLASIALLTFIVLFLEKASIPSRWVKLTLYLSSISIPHWLGILPKAQVGTPTLLWVSILFALYCGIKWITERLNGELPAGVEQSVLFRLVFVISVVLATAWPYPSIEFISGFCVTVLFIGLGIMVKGTTWRPVAGLDRLVGVLLLIFTINIQHETSGLKGSFGGEQMLIESGIFRSAIIPHKREQRFMQIAEHIRAELPIDARIAGYPNLALSMIAAGFVPITFQGNYFGDDGVDIEAFAADVRRKRVDCVLVNESRWPYSPSHPFFPDAKLIIDALGDDFQKKSRFDLVGFYCRQSLNMKP